MPTSCSPVGSVLSQSKSGQVCTYAQFAGHASKTRPHASSLALVSGQNLPASGVTAPTATEQPSVQKVVPHEPSLEELYFAVRRSARDLGEGAEGYGFTQEEAIR